MGVQVVDTDQSSSGYLGIVNPQFTVDPNPTSGSAKYTKVLPSLNISTELTDTQFVRFGASKTISRARVDQMKASGFVKFDQNIDLMLSRDVVADGTPWSKFQGNPKLKPLESNNLDLSYENYFADDGYVSVSYFYKDLVSWTREGKTIIDFTKDSTNNNANYYIPSFHDKTVQTSGTYGPNDVFYNAGTVVAPAQFKGYFSSYEDGLTGTVKGTEITANIPLNIVSDVLNGFGVATSASFIDAKLDDGTKIPGQSDRVYSLTAYYTLGGFEVRFAGTKRTGFTSYQRGGSNKIDTVKREGVELLDAQISYDFSESGIESLHGLRVSLQGTNLTNVKEEDIGDTGLPNASRSFGPTYMLNLNYKF